MCNSNFNRKNSSCVRFKIFNSNFNRRNSFCVRFKICNSNFNRRNSSCAFLNLQLEFFRQNPSCVHFKILPQKSESAQIFTAKFQVKIQNPSCAFQNLQLGLFRVDTWLPYPLHWMGKLFHYALFESFAYNNAYYSKCDRVIINYLISTFCVERANES